MVKTSEGYMTLGELAKISKAMRDNGTDPELNILFMCDACWEHGCENHWVEFIEPVDTWYKDIDGIATEQTGCINLLDHQTWEYARSQDNNTVEDFMKKVYGGGSDE